MNRKIIVVILGLVAVIGITLWKRSSSLPLGDEAQLNQWAGSAAHSGRKPASISSSSVKRESSQHLREHYKSLLESAPEVPTVPKLSQNQPEEGFSKNPLPSDPLLQKLKPYRVIATQEKPIGSNGSFQRVQVLKTSSNFAFVRNQEIWIPKDNGFVLSQRKVMAGDHIVVRLKEGASDSELEASLKSYGAQIQRRLPASGLYLISFDGKSPDQMIDTFDELLHHLQTKDFVEHSGPDYLVSN